MIDTRDLDTDFIWSQRSNAAEQIHKIRLDEKRAGVPTNRGKDNYLGDFSGLRHFFAYTRSNGSSNKVLDIGAGTTRAAYELSQDEMCKGLDFRATVLSRNEYIPKYLGYDKTLITSAEALDGIENGSIGAILADCSISYSASPYLAVKKMYDVLAPGGILKMTFGRLSLSGDLDSYPPEKFILEMKKRNFKIGKLMKKSFRGISDEEIDVVLAIKPGGNPDIDSQQLIEADRTDYLSLRAVQGKQIN